MVSRVISHKMEGRSGCEAMQKLYVVARVKKHMLQDFRITPCSHLRTWGEISG